MSVGIEKSFVHRNYFCRVSTSASSLWLSIISAVCHILWGERMPTPCARPMYYRIVFCFLSMADNSYPISASQRLALENFGVLDTDAPQPLDEVEIDVLADRA